MANSAELDSTPSSLLSPIYALLSHLYGLVTRLRNFFFDIRFFSAYRSSLPVICVGNITVGGTGKTPFVRHLVESLRARGETPVVLTRGYGGRRRGPYLAKASDGAAEVGDEPKMLLSDTELRVVIARSRVLGAQFIEREKLGSIIVLDDGYQHRWLDRQLNIVCINVADEKACRDFLANRMLPWGIFREPREAALRRADAIVLSARRPIKAGTELPHIRAVAAGLPQGLPRFISSVRDQRVEHTNGRVQLFPQAVCAVCAIANPGGFFATLEDSGYAVNERVVLADHSPRIAEVVEESLSRTALPIVLTEKDAVKLPETLRANARINVLRFDLHVEEKEVLDRLLGEVAGERIG